MKTQGKINFDVIALDSNGYAIHQQEIEAVDRTHACELMINELDSEEKSLVAGFKVEKEGLPIVPHSEVGYPIPF